MKNKILILGFPHSGTTILRKVLGNHSDIFAVPAESRRAPNTRHEKKFTCIKWPHYDDAFFSSAYDDYYKIFIIRNPLFCFSSLQRRGQTLTGKHSCDFWEKTANKFLSLENREDTFCLKYEDIFENNFQKLRDVFAFIGLPFEEQVLATEKQTSSPAPSPRSHYSFRMWQIDQPFENNNKPEKNTVGTTIAQRLRSMNSFCKLYGGGTPQ